MLGYLLARAGIEVLVLESQGIKPLLSASPLSALTLMSWMPAKNQSTAGVPGPELAALKVLAARSSLIVVPQISLLPPLSPPPVRDG